MAGIAQRAHDSSSTTETRKRRLAFACAVFTLTLGAALVPGCERRIIDDGGDGTPGDHTRDEIDAMYAGTANCGGLGGDCDGEGELNHCCGKMSCDILNCCVLGGNPCFESSDCCSRSCNAGTCGCSEVDDACLLDADCCQDQPRVCYGNGGNTGAYAGRCVTAPGGACTGDLDCVGGQCGAGGVCTCSMEYHPCAGQSDCCSGLQCEFSSSGRGTCHSP